MNKYELEKKIWTEVDFDQMGWHDSRIYKIRLTSNLELDIDYILQWNKSEIDGFPFTFWVAPATLNFRNVKNFQFDIDTLSDDANEILDIELQTAGNIFQWVIITRQGDFQFEADGFTQWIRQEPFFQFGQTISYIERFGVSLEQTIDQNNPNRNREDIIEKRKEGLRAFRKRKEQTIKKNGRG